MPEAGDTGFLGNKSPTYKTLQGRSCCPYKMIVTWCGVRRGVEGGARRGSSVSAWFLRGVRVSGLVMSQVLQSSALGLLLPAPV